MNKFVKRISLFWFLLFQLTILSSFGQSPVAGFAVQSPLCAGQALQLTNLSHASSTLNYEWDFCPGYLHNPPQLIQDSLLPGGLEGIAIVHEGNLRIVFATSRYSNTIYRIHYDNGFDQPITMIEDLNMITDLSQPSGIKIFKENNIWYALVVNFNDNSFLRVQMGNTLTDSTFTTTVLATGTTSQFDGPRGIDIIRDSTGSIFAAVTNMFSSAISIIRFGNSITNTPAISAPVAITGGTFPLGVRVVSSSSHWYAFIPCYTTNNIIRADLGTSVTPSSFSSIASVSSASGLDIVNDSAEWRIISSGYYSQQFSRFTLGSDITNPVATPIGTNPFGGNIPRSLGLVKENGKYICISTFESGDLVNFSFNNNCGIARESTDSLPASIALTTPGSQSIFLTVTDQNGNSDYKIANINILPSPVINYSTTLNCEGDPTSFLDSTFIQTGTLASWNWNFGDSSVSTVQSPSHTFSSSGTYHVTLAVDASSGCSSTLVRSVSIYKKPSVYFSATPGCSDRPILFNDSSIANSGGISAWRWTFGTGDSSALQNPAYVYSHGGSFPVTLTINTDSGCSSSRTQYYNIYDRPHSAFTTANTCVGASTQFNNLTSISGSTISSTYWNFGDGDTTSVLNPQHSFASSVATYNVKIISTAANGCVDSSIQTIKINNIPSVNFSVSPVTVCQNNDVFFTDLSSVTGDTISAWDWNFGDNTSDSVKNPIHRFTGNGLHTVTLTSYSPSSCPGVLHSVIVNVKESPVALFDHSITCEGSPTHFINNSHPATSGTISSSKWQFTPGDSSSLYSPDFLFNAAENFPVTLIVMSPEGCTGTFTETVVVHQRPLASFLRSVSCTGNAVNFSNSSVSDSLSVITQYAWNFGDFSSPSNTSALPSPSHLYIQPLQYSASLITTTDFGCIDTAIETFTVNQSPQVNFSYSPTCYGNLMEFFNPGSPLDSAFLWNFGDNQNNQLREPAHYYAFPGTYNVSLNVTATTGCSTTATKQVTVSPIPSADFETTPACLNTLYQFEDASSVSSGSVVNWEWNIDGNTSPDAIENPEYLFPDTGNYHVTLVVTSDIGCSKTTTKTISVYGPPVANFTLTPQYGIPPLDVQATDYSQGALNYIWDFGDGTIENLSSPSHTFTDTGVFTVTQYITSAYGCVDSLSKKINVSKPVLDVAITGDSSYFEGNYFHVVAQIKNLGTRDINSLQMEAYHENGSTISEMLHELIPSGPSGLKTYAFTAAFLVGSEKDFNFYCMRAIDPNGEQDDHPENNERCINLTNEPAGISLFPNPCINTMNIQMILPYSGSLTIDIFNDQGKKMKDVYDGIASKSLKQFQVDMSEYDSGIYLVRIKFGELEYFKRVMHE